MKRHCLIIGAGYTGLSAAYDLVRKGWSVSILEADSDVGGLAGTFELFPGCRIEKFYHHWFTSDTAVLDFISELGLESLTQYHNSNTGLYYSNSIFRLASPLDLLRFTPLKLHNRVRTGLMALYARTIDNWSTLEAMSAEEWIIKVAGRESFEVIWKPLLSGKFGPEASNVSAVWFWNKLKLRGSSRGKDNKESLVYFKGGFAALTQAMRQKLEESGVVIHTNTSVSSIVSSEVGVKGVETSRGFEAADSVLSTVPLPQFLDMTPQLPQAYTEPARKIRFLGNVCLILALKRSLSSTYWLNVADPTFPFVGVIEHTNLDRPENYGGKRIAYISKYLPTTDKLFSFNAEEFFTFCLPYVKKIFPEFSADWVEKYYLWKASYSQPVITKHYSTFIPAMKTPIKNLWLCTMAQVYPEDRGTNYAVAYGRKVAKEICSF